MPAQIAMKAQTHIKKPWLKPIVKIVSIKRDTFVGTRGPKEAGGRYLSHDRRV